HFMPGLIYPKTFSSPGQVSLEQAMELLRQGYFAIRVTSMPENRHHGLPLVIFNQRTPLAASPNLGTEANFFLARDGVPAYAVINGYLIDLAAGPQEAFKNYVQ